MNNYEKYYNDPEIVNEPAPLREVHAIRLMIHGETKDMTLDQRKLRLSKIVDVAQKEFGFKRVASAKDKLS